LISDEELFEIRRIWRTERLDWDDSLPKIVEEVTGQHLNFPADDDGTFDADQKAMLGSICAEYDVPIDLVARLLEVEPGVLGYQARLPQPCERSGVLLRNC
jgi:DNA sulfur modification protein DndC